MDKLVIKIAKEFTTVPGPRYIHEGKWSGEEFRTQKFYQLISGAIQANQSIVVDLDGTLGYGTSFLEEIFGGLIRIHHINYDDLVSRLEIVSNEEPYLIDDIAHYLKEANEKALATA